MQKPLKGPEHATVETPPSHRLFDPKKISPVLLQTQSCPTTLKMPLHPRLTLVLAMLPSQISLLYFALLLPPCLPIPICKPQPAPLPTTPALICFFRLHTRSALRATRCLLLHQHHWTRSKKNWLMKDIPIPTFYSMYLFPS